ncbi:hypothetical protein ANO11243_031270 [Dothideomycetidae sp. 11243]|nr:hypothetical protein ANO11243_031270 [fungal sp. No.11243]
MDNESEEHREHRIRSLWDKLDVRKEGSLDIVALKLGLKKLEHPLQNADDLISDVLHAADINHDGLVQFEGLTGFRISKNIDRDHNGNVDKDELKSAFVRAGVAVPDSRLEMFFNDVDSNNDGVISFEEWRNFLLFMPPSLVGMKAVLSYYQSTVKVNSEGDVHLSDETIQGLGTASSFLHTHVFGAILQILSPSTSYQYHRPRMADADPSPALHVLDAQDQDRGAAHEELADGLVMSQQEGEAHHPVLLQEQHVERSDASPRGYFLAGGLSGVASRTTTAPLDRLKVYLIAQTDSASAAVENAKKGAPVQATKQSAHTLINACRDLWAAGGIRSLFAGNGINIIKVMPESAVKFGSYEAAKRVISKLEGHGDSKRISPSSQFVAGGVAGMMSQAVSVRSAGQRLRYRIVR